MLETDIYKALKEINFFSPISNKNLKLIATHLKEIRLNIDETLFNYGDDSNGMYFVVSGHLIAGIFTQSQQRRLSPIMPGETIGELGLITKEKRSLTVIATCETTLLHLDILGFEFLNKKIPGFLNSFFDVIVKRLRRAVELIPFNHSESVKTVTISPLNLSTPSIQLAENFANILTFPPKCIVLSHDVIKKELNQKVSHSLITEYLQKIEREYRVIVYLFSGKDDLIDQMFVSRSERIYFIENIQSEFPNLSSNSTVNLKISKYLRRNLIILRETESIPQNDFLSQAQTAGFHECIHVNIASVEDKNRASRIIYGNAFGLVLSGGGAKIWAQIGAIQALHRLNIPIDYIGGVSAGSAVAAAYLLDRHGFVQNFEKIMPDYVTMQNSFSSMSQFTFPITSIFSSHGLNKILKKNFGSTLIEELPINYFSVSFNLSQSEQVIIRTGSLWESIRMSLSIPVIYPPFTKDGELYIDGGIMNNLPTDIMRDMLGPRGKVISVNVINQIPSSKHFKIPLDMTINQGLKYAFLKKYRSKTKSLSEIAMDSIFAGSTAKTIENLKYSNINITPETQGFSTIEKPRIKRIEALIQRGYNATYHLSNELLRLLDQ